MGALNRSQIATGSQKHRDPRFPPYAFTEHGAIMLPQSSIARGPSSVYIVRAFVHLRELLASNQELARRFAQLETQLDKKLATHDEAIAALLSAIRQLMRPPVPNAGGMSVAATIASFAASSSAAGIETTTAGTDRVVGDSPLVLDHLGHQLRVLGIRCDRHGVFREGDATCLSQALHRDFRL